MLNPYKYTHESSGALYFSTDAGREYRAFFVEGEGYFPAYPNISANMFVFSFVPVGEYYTGEIETIDGTRKRRVRSDPRVRDTILAVIIDYLNHNKDNGLIYICDTKHRASVSRNQLFGKWKSTFQVSISKHDAAIHDGDGNPSAYVSLLIHDDCTHHREMVDAFMAIDDDLRDKGY